MPPITHLPDVPVITVLIPGGMASVGCGQCRCGVGRGVANLLPEGDDGVAVGWGTGVQVGGTVAVGVDDTWPDDSDSVTVGCGFGVQVGAGVQVGSGVQEGSGVQVGGNVAVGVDGVRPDDGNGVAVGCGFGVLVGAGVQVDSSVGVGVGTGEAISPATQPTTSRAITAAVAICRQAIRPDCIGIVGCILPPCTKIAGK